LPSGDATSAKIAATAQKISAIIPVTAANCQMFDARVSPPHNEIDGSGNCTFMMCSGPAYARIAASAAIAGSAHRTRSGRRRPIATPSPMPRNAASRMRLEK
jgi:hypothetical protein